METIENKFRKALIGATIKELNFFIAGENFLVLDPEHIWILDVGMEMVLDNTTISYGVNIDMRLWDMVEDNMETLTGELDIFELEPEEMPIKSTLIGQKIKEVSFNWNWYHKLDDDFVPVQEKTYIPFEMILTFDSGDTLQLASVVFALEGEEMTRPKYNSQGQLLVAFNKPVEIEDVE